MKKCIHVIILFRSGKILGYLEHDLNLGSMGKFITALETLLTHTSYITLYIYKYSQARVAESLIMDQCIFYASCLVCRIIASFSFLLFFPMIGEWIICILSPKKWERVNSALRKMSIHTACFLRWFTRLTEADHSITPVCMLSPTHANMSLPEIMAPTIE